MNLRWVHSLLVKATPRKGYVDLEWGIRSLWALSSLSLPWRGHVSYSTRCLLKPCKSTQTKSKIWKRSFICSQQALQYSPMMLFQYDMAEQKYNFCVVIRKSQNSTYQLSISRLMSARFHRRSPGNLIFFKESI